jgi:hypothetical protein
MELVIAGIGSWSERFPSWPALLRYLRAGADMPDDVVPPGPFAERIPDRERRRAPLHVKIAVEVAQQAVDASGFDPASLPSVFTSGMGDVKTTDLICRALAAPQKIISPTHFHNSVHNASSGYWSIAAACHERSNSVSGFRHSFGIALLEAAVLCQTEGRPTMLVACDIGTERPLDAICPIAGPFGVALVLGPSGTAGHARMEISLEPASGGDDEESDLATRLGLAGNPAARALDLLARLATGATARPLAMPIGSGTRLLVKVLQEQEQ